MKKLQFIILEQDGNIDIQEKNYGETLAEGIAALEHITRFVRLFKDDPYKRVARVTEGKNVIVNYDSVLDKFTFNRQVCK